MDFGLRELIMLGGIMFAAGGFYLLANHRLNKVEAAVDKLDIEKQEKALCSVMHSNLHDAIQHLVSAVYKVADEQKESTKQINERIDRLIKSNGG